MPLTKPLYVAAIINSDAGPGGATRTPLGPCFYADLVLAPPGDRNAPGRGRFVARR